MTKLAVTTANTCVGVYADSEADKAEGATDPGAKAADALDTHWEEPAQPATFQPLHTNRPPPSRAHKSAPAQPKPGVSIPRAPALPRELRPPIAASRRDLTAARPTSAKRSEPRKRRLSPPKKPSQPAPSTVESSRPTKPSPAASSTQTSKPHEVRRSSASIPPRPVSVVPRPASKSVPPPAPTAPVEAKQRETPKQSLRPLPPSQRSKPLVGKPSAVGDASTENEPILLAKPRPAKPRQTFSETPSIAASYVASLGSSVPPTKPSPGTLSTSVKAAAADRSDQSRKEPHPAARAPEEPHDSVEPTRVDVSQQALAPKADPPEPLDADADDEDTEVVDRATVLASRRQAQKERLADAEQTPVDTLLPPSTPTAASGQAMEVIRREASAAAASPPAEEEHPPPATETDAPVAIDLTPADVPEPTETATDLYLAGIGKAREAWRSPRARWAAGAGALVIGVAALLMLTSESSDPGEAELAATLPAAAEQVAAPRPDQPDVKSKASSPAPADEPEAAETSEPAPLAIRSVAVQTYPANAVIYSGGQRLGKGAVEVRLPAGEQKVLWVKCDGYASRQVVLDGSATEVDVALVKRSAVDSVDEQPIAEAEPEADSPADPEAATPAQPAAPDPLAVSVPTRDDPYASVPDAEPSPGKGTTPSRDDPALAVPSGKSQPGRWEENPGF